MSFENRRLEGVFYVRSDVCDALAARVRELQRDLDGYRRALVAHHDLSTLSDDVIREYDWRECPICKRARSER